MYRYNWGIVCDTYTRGVEGLLILLARMDDDGVGDLFVFVVTAHAGDGGGGGDG